MPILKFLLLAIRPVSKLEAVVGWRDVLNFLIMVGYITIPGVGSLPQWLEKIPLAWFAGIPASLFLIAGIKLQFKLDRLEATRPRITVEPKVYRNEAFLEVLNHGASASFQATGRVNATNTSSQSYVMYWEGLGANCTIDKYGQGAIKVAERAKTMIIDGRDAETAIYEGDLVGFKMGTSGEQIFPIRTYVQRTEDERIIGTIEDKGVVEITITSNPPLAKLAKRSYLLEFDESRNLRFTELLTPDKESSQTE